MRYRATKCTKMALSALQCSEVKCSGVESHLSGNLACTPGPRVASGSMQIITIKYPLGPPSIEPDELAINPLNPTPKVTFLVTGS